VIVELISNTTTEAGLIVKAVIDTTDYKTGGKSATKSWRRSTSVARGSTANGTTRSFLEREIDQVNVSRTPSTPPEEES
jgi:hypothetical protein